MTTGAAMVTDEARRLKRAQGKIDPETGSNSGACPVPRKLDFIAMQLVSLVVRDEIGCQTVRDVGRQADEMASSILGVRRAYDELGVHQPLDKALRAARRQTRADAKRPRRDRRSLTMRDEKLDEHIPRRLAEKPVGTQQLPAQQEASDRSPRVRQCAGQSGAEGAIGEIGAIYAQQVLPRRAQAEGLRYFAAG